MLESFPPATKVSAILLELPAWARHEILAEFLDFRTDLAAHRFRDKPDD